MSSPRIASLFVLLSCSAVLADVSFTAKPAVSPAEGGLAVKFELSQSADVEVAVVDESGAVVRHLAAGLIGGEKAVPPLVAKSLAQTIVWDRTDDDGRPVAGRKVSFRVRAGLTPKLGKIIGEPARLTGKVYGLATDEKGNLFVASGGVYSTPLFSIKVYDRQGKYLRTILPMPADLTADQAAGFGQVRDIDGRLTPGNFNPLVPYVQQGGVTSFVGGQARQGVLWLVNSEGKLCRISDRGAAVAWKTAPKSKGPSGGPMCWAVSPDNKTVYLAGWWDSRAASAKKYDQTSDGTVFKVDPTTGATEPFIKIDVPDNSVWLNNRDGHFHFTNWGRKNGVAALHGLAVDGKGQLYVCDRVNQRLSVYDAAGKLVGSTAVEWPDHVALSPKGDAVYVITRKVLDDYKAINEFRIVKLSSAVNGQVLAELTLKGNNAPSAAVDATAEPAVIWLSNVGDNGDKLVRIEDRGKELVLAGELNDKLPASDAIVKVFVDPARDDVYVNNGWNGLSRYDGLTGAGGPIAIKAIDMAVDRNGLLYLYGQKGWNEPIYRCDRDFKPVPFAGTGKPVTTDCTAEKDGKPMPIYGRYGTGWSNKGIAIGTDGRIYVRSMYDWAKYFVTVFKPDGTAERHQRIQGGIIGPVDSTSGGICVDRQGNFYLGTNEWPVELGKARGIMDGCVVKVTPPGGMEPVAKDSAGKPAPGEGMLFANYRFAGATTAYPYLAPRADRGCVCKEARFDLDEFGRLYVPDVLDFCIRVYDNAGNLIGRFGHYGNADAIGQAGASGQGGAGAGPAIPLGWPMSCAINRAGRLYIADVLNQRIVRVDATFQAEMNASE